MDYTIQKGDNLSTLAKRFGTTVAKLAEANGISNPDRIFAGKTLTIPDQPKPKPQKEWRQGLLTGDPAMFNPQAQALEGSYPEMALLGLPGIARAVASRGLLSAPQAVSEAMPAVMRQNTTRLFNELSRQAVANEPKFWIGGNAVPEAVQLERFIAANRFK